MEPELKQIRVQTRCGDEKIAEVGLPLSPDDSDTRFSPGPCLHNKRFACVFVPCVIPLYFIAGELLFGVSILALVVVYLVESAAKFRRSCMVAFVLAMVGIQLTSIYCLLPYIWHSVFNVGLVFIYNVFIILSGGVGLLQFKQLQYDEPQFIVYLEYILFVTYPLVGQFVMTSVSALVLGWWSAPYFCIVYGFLFIQLFYPPSKPSFVYQSSVHKSGQHIIPDRYIIGPMEKTLLLFNLITVPGSMFIVIYLLDFLHLITWVKLLFCGLFPVFLCTCLDTGEVRDFLEFTRSTFSKARVFSGLASLLIFAVVMWWSGKVSSKAVPVLAGSALIGLAMGYSAKAAKFKAYHPWSCLAMGFLYVFGIWSCLWNLDTGFVLSSSSLIVLLLSLSTLAVLSVVAVLLSNVSRASAFGGILVLQSFGVVVCEKIMLENKLYTVHYLLLSSLLLLYLVYRLHVVQAVDWRSVWLCASLQCCKLPVILASALPSRALDQSFLFPSWLNSYSMLIMFLFVLVTSRVLVFTERKIWSVPQGAKSCAVVGIAVVAVHDSLILPAWIFVTHRWPSMADAVASVLFVSGALCLRITLSHLYHTLDAKRANIVLLCGGVLVEIVQPEFNIPRVVGSLWNYLTSVMFPYSVTVEILWGEEVTLPWLILLSALTGLCILVKLVKLDQLHPWTRVLTSVLIGAPVGFKVFSLLHFPLTRPPMVCLLYAIATCAVVFLLISSWHGTGQENKRTRALSYMALVASLVLSFVLESRVDRQIILQYNYKDPMSKTGILPCLPYNMVLHLVLAIALKAESATFEESLEDKKGKVPIASATVTSSFLANMSVILSCALGLMCTQQDYWELWVSFCTIILMLIRPEGVISTHGRPIKISPYLLPAMLLPVCMYSGTIMTAWPASIGFLSILGFLTEMLLLHLALPTYYSLAHALWKGNIPLTIQRAAVFTAPACLALLVYGSTVAGRIMGVLGIFCTYFVFMYVSCPDFDNKT